MVIKKKEESSMLVSDDTYLSAGIHIGTKYGTKSMQAFIYKVNPDGLSVMNLEIINERLRIAGKFLSHYEPQDILVVGRRENAWTAIKAFSKVIGAREYAGRYPAGTITNTNLKTFFEPKVLLVTDPWPDKNAVHDAKLTGIPIVGLCDTNNRISDVDLVIPCNNKGTKSLGLVYWILANQYLKERGILPKDKDLSVPVEKFAGEEITK